MPDRPFSQTYAMSKDYANVSCCFSGIRVPEKTWGRPAATNQKCVRVCVCECVGQGRKDMFSCFIPQSLSVIVAVIVGRFRRNSMDDCDEDYDGHGLQLVPPTVHRPPQRGYNLERSYPPMLVPRTAAAAHYVMRRVPAVQKGSSTARIHASGAMLLPADGRFDLRPQVVRRLCVWRNQTSF